MKPRRTQRRRPLWRFFLISLLLHPLVLGLPYFLLERPKDTEQSEAVEVEFVPPSDLELSPERLPSAREKERQEEKQQTPPPPEQMREQKRNELEKFLRMKMVEVNQPETEPPENARFLSDKDRRVDEETRARETGTPEDQQASEQRQGPQPSGEQQSGGQGTMSAEQRAAALLQMRRPPGTSQLTLTQGDYERLFGGQAQQESTRMEREYRASRPNRWAQKWGRMKGALENFVGEVKMGNQTALGTRASPFAVYIARMHQSIHELWGYGFLVDLDRQSGKSPFDDMTLWTTIEIVVKPDGQVAKATVVRASGALPFDVAALDAVFSAAPYPPTPENIRSGDGNVYMHWRFHRDQRQCGTFGVDPFILDQQPGSHESHEDHG